LENGQPAFSENISLYTHTHTVIYASNTMGHSLISVAALERARLGTQAEDRRFEHLL